MAKYFIDREIWFENQKQTPRKVILFNIEEDLNNNTITGYDKDSNEYTLNISDVFDDNENPVKDARIRLGLSQVKFAKKFEIPIRTLEDWESGKSKPPKYVLNLLLEKVFSML